MSYKAVLQSLYKIIAPAPGWFVAGLTLGGMGCAYMLSGAGGAPTTELVAAVQIGQYWLKLNVSPQPLEHPNRMMATLKHTLFDTTESQSHIVSYSYVADSDPWGLRLTVLSKNPSLTRQSLEASVKALVDRQNGSYDRLAESFSKKREALAGEQKALSELVRDNLGARSQKAELSAIIARSIIANNEVAQIETSLTTDPAHFRKSSYIISEQPKTMGRLRMLALITMGILLSLGTGILAAKIGAPSTKPM